MRWTVVCAALLISLVWLAGSPNPGLAGAQGTCTLAEAKRDVQRAERALEEARYVARQTATQTESYGATVGRWVRLARRTGWHKADIGALCYIINRESRGQAGAQNPSGASGLLQLMAIWYDGRWHFDPLKARLNLLYGHKVQHLQGWSAWAYPSAP